MKYAKFSDDFLSDFSLDDSGKTLVLTDKRGYTRAVKLLSYEERPQGEWIDYSEEGFVECPFCHKATTCEDNIDELHYCWNCGAKMKGGAECSQTEK